MKVFLSWSKSPSLEVASAFANWLPKVIQECSEPFISTETVKGDPWFATITNAIDDSKLGVVFISGLNADESWLNFEAGALLTKFGKQRLCPVLIGLSKSEYSGPLKNLQLTELNDRDDAYALLKTINDECDRPLADGILRSAFNAHWPELADAIIAATSSSTETVATPNRTVEDKIDELLLLARDNSRRSVSQPSSGERHTAFAKAAQRQLFKDLVAERGEFVLIDGELVGEMIDARRFRDPVSENSFTEIMYRSEENGIELSARLEEVVLSKAPF